MAKYYAKSTEKAEKILNFVKNFTMEKGYPPTVREIVKCPDINVKSTASVKTYLDRLEMEGKINKSISGSKARAIEVKGLAMKEEANTEDEPLNATRIPLLGNIAAGQPLYAGVENDRSYCVPDDYFTVKKNEMFLLQVKGVSMINMGILDGDIVLVKSQQTALNGQVIVAQIDNNEVTLKRYYNCGSYIKLKPENDSMDDIIITQDHTFRILGIATGLMRNHLV